MRPHWSVLTTDAWSPDGGYVIAGSVLQATSAGVGLAVWCIRAGRVNGIVVSGQVVVNCDGVYAAKGGGSAVMLLDEAATPEQTLALVDLFSGRLGGPLADLVGPSGRARSLSQVPLQYREFRWSFHAPRRSS